MITSQGYMQLNGIDIILSTVELLSMSHTPFQHRPYSRPSQPQEQQTLEMLKCIYNRHAAAFKIWRTPCNTTTALLEQASQQHPTRYPRVHLKYHSCTSLALQQCSKGLQQYPNIKLVRTLPACQQYDWQYSNCTPTARSQMYCKCETRQYLQKHHADTFSSYLSNTASSPPKVLLQRYL